MSTAFVAFSVFPFLGLHPQTCRRCQGTMSTSILIRLFLSTGTKSLQNKLFRSTINCRVPKWTGNISSVSLLSKITALLVKKSYLLEYSTNKKIGPEYLNDYFKCGFIMRPLYLVIISPQHGALISAFFLKFMQMGSIEQISNIISIFF